MLKLLKYDWKKNANGAILAAAVLLLAQTALTVAAAWNGWDPILVYGLMIFIYVIGGIIAFLMACQTFNGNLQSYSRRLLPLPPLYTIATPIILLLAAYAAFGILFVAHNAIFASIYDIESSLLSAILVHLSLMDRVIIVLSLAWLLLLGALPVFFSIAVARSIGGRSGIFAGVATWFIIATVFPWLQDRLFSSANTGFHASVDIEGDWLGFGSGGFEFGSFELQGLQWYAITYDIAVMALLVYGTVYLMDRKVKL